MKEFKYNIGDHVKEINGSIGIIVECHRKLSGKRTYNYYIVQFGDIKVSVDEATVDSGYVDPIEAAK